MLFDKCKKCDLPAQFERFSKQYRDMQDKVRAVKQKEDRIQKLEREIVVLAAENTALRSMSHQGYASDEQSRD